MRISLAPMSRPLVSRASGVPTNGRPELTSKSDVAEIAGKIRDDMLRDLLRAPVAAFRARARLVASRARASFFQSGAVRIAVSLDKAANIQFGLTTNGVTKPFPPENPPPPVLPKKFPCRP